MRSNRLASATSTVAPESCSPYRISSVFHQPFRPTSTAPLATVAQNVRHHSGLFWLSTATRSPGPMPQRSARARATPLACSTKLPNP